MSLVECFELPENAVLSEVRRPEYNNFSSIHQFIYVTPKAKVRFTRTRRKVELAYDR